MDEHCFATGADSTRQAVPGEFPPSAGRALGVRERALVAAEVGAFAAAYRRQREVFPATEGNNGGNGLYQSFGIWVTLRLLRPPVIIESGVWKGQTSWMIRQATAGWKPAFIRFDPSKREGLWKDTESRATLDFIGDHFVDFSKQPWRKGSAHMPVGLKASEPPATELILFCGNQQSQHK